MKIRGKKNNGRYFVSFSFPRRLCERRSGAWSDGTARLARRKRESKSNGSPIKAFGDDTGSIVVLSSIVFLVMIGFVALAIDIAMVQAHKRSAANCTDMLVLAASHGYHLNEVVEGEVKNLTLQQQHYYRMVVGQKTAYDVYQECENDTLFNRAKFEDPFSGVNWDTKYDAVKADAQPDGVLQGPTIDDIFTSYANSDVRYLIKSAGVYSDPGDACMRGNCGADNPNNVDDPFDVRAASTNFVMKPTESLSAILAKPFGFASFKTTAASRAEVANSGPVNVVIMVIDRSLAMAGESGDAAYLLDTDPDMSDANPIIQKLKRERYQGLSQADRDKMVDTNATLQPITSMLQAARAVTKSLGKANWFKDGGSATYTDLGIVAYDAVAEHTHLGGSTFISDNTCAGCDNRENTYKDVQTYLSAHIPLKGRPGLPKIETLCGGGSDINQLECRECFTATCTDYNAGCVDPADETFVTVSSARCGTADTVNISESQDRWQSPLTAPALSPFFPWTVSNEGVGMEIAIEIIRQLKPSFSIFGSDINRYFKGHIILFSDGLVNAYHDRDKVADLFPRKNGVACDTLGFGSYRTRETMNAAGVPPPVWGNLVPYWTPVVAGWRRHQISDNVSYNVSSPANCPGNICKDTYHNGADKWSNVGGIDPIITPNPSGVLTNANTVDSESDPTLTYLYQAPAKCPGPFCTGVYLGYPDDLAVGDTGRKPGFKLTCAELAFMDFVDHADFNKITTHVVAFGDIKQPYVKSAFNNDPAMWSSNEQFKRQFLLKYATDSLEDSQNVGFFISKPTCGDADGCKDLEGAVNEAMVQLEARLMQ